MNTPKWEGKKLDLIREACRHGESKLAAQVQIATSADQRATVLAGIYVAASTGVIGALATSSAIIGNLPLLVGGGITAGAFLVAAVLNIFGTLPVDFYVPGNDPHEWYPDIEADRDVGAAIGEQAAHFDDQIAKNNVVMKRNALFFRSGALIGICAPIIGLIAAGITYLLA
jgi:hypothetical protein